MASKYRVTVNFETRKEKELVEKAAKIERRSLSSFVINYTVPAAKSVIKKATETETKGAVA